MPIIVDRERLEAIASACTTSSNTMQQEATNMRKQMDEFREALSGISNLALADRFNEWNSLFNKMSQALEESNAYLKNVINSVDDFVARLGQ